jgi:uncharacterized phage-associated protein
MTSARDVAAELRQRLPDVGVKKLHKLLYYAQGHHLAALGRPLFSESISAWDMGPVVGEFWWQEQNSADSPRPQPLDEAGLNTVGYVLSRYGALSGNELERLTHSEPPWQEANRSRQPGASSRIGLDVVQRFFEDEARRDEDPGPEPAVVRALLLGARDRLRVPARADSIEELLERASSVD